MYRSSANVQPIQTPGQSAGPSGQREMKAAATPDPSIAKAHAANVDTKVFGIPLGEPLQLPTCASMFDSSRTCLQKEVPAEVFDTLTSMMTVFGAAPAAPTMEDARMGVRIVELTSDACPWWLSGCTARLMTYDGLLVAVSIDTKGHTVDQAAAKDLRTKYGAPTSVRPISVTPRVGNPYKANDLE